MQFLILLCYAFNSWWGSLCLYIYSFSHSCASWCYDTACVNYSSFPPIHLLCVKWHESIFLSNFISDGGGSMDFWISVPKVQSSKINGILTSLIMVLETGPLVGMDSLKKNEIFCWSSSFLFSQLIQWRWVTFPSEEHFRFFISEVCHLQPRLLRYLYVITTHRQAFGTVILNIMHTFYTLSCCG